MIWRLFFLKENNKGLLVRFCGKRKVSDNPHPLKGKTRKELFSSFSQVYDNGLLILLHGQKLSLFQGVPYLF